jgi:hypothetical protein
MDIQTLERDINDRDASTRMAASVKLGSLIRGGELGRTVTEEVNNHVHTTYSFSPYEPAAAAYAAWKAGLGIVGSIDHDSIGAAAEMLESGRNIGIATTVGFELRVSFLDTPLANRKINNPDSEGIVYMCVHGVAKQHIPAVASFIKPLQEVRNKRTRGQVVTVSTLTSSAMCFLSPVFLKAAR